MTQLRFHIDRTSPPQTETVPAKRIGEHLYELLGSPGFAAGFAKGDHVYVDPRNNDSHRLVLRGGNICIQIFLKDISDSAPCILHEIISTFGGELEGGKTGSPLGQLCIVSIAVTYGFPHIEKMMEAVGRRVAVETWMYGNVYDESDGVTPLNWWL